VVVRIVAAIFDGKSEEEIWMDSQYLGLLRMVNSEHSCGIKIKIL